MKKYHIKCMTGILLLLILCNAMQIDGKRLFSSKKKSPSPSTNHNSKPSYPTQSYSHSDMTKLSYGGGTHAQPNSGGSSSHAGAPAPIGWNVPNKQPAGGPPPPYSASNPIGGAKTNINEPPPVYKPASTYQGQPVPAQTYQGHGVPAQTYQGHGVPAQTYQGSYPAGATYHNSVPAGATYHNSVPAGASYYNSPPGGPTYHYAPQGATYHSPGALPPGATYYSSPNAIPAGAIYQQAPQSSGPGLGTGLIAGAIGGAILGHVLTPSGGTQTVHAPPATGTSTGEDKIIIINNGPPGSVTTTDVGSGTTVINAGGVAAPAGAPAAAVNPVASAAAVPLAPMSNTETAAVQASAPPNQNAAPPAGGGIICVPVRVNETDPADATKMIELEKIACYPAPAQEPAPAAAANTPAVTVAAPAPVPVVDGGNVAGVRSSLERSGTNKNLPETFVTTFVTAIIVFAMRF